MLKETHAYFSLTLHGNHRLLERLSLLMVVSQVFRLMKQPLFSLFLVIAGSMLPQQLNAPAWKWHIMLLLSIQCFDLVRGHQEVYSYHVLRRGRPEIFDKQHQWWSHSYYNTLWNFKWFYKIIFWFCILCVMEKSEKSKKAWRINITLFLIQPSRNYA